MKFLSNLFKKNVPKEPKKAKIGRGIATVRLKSKNKHEVTIFGNFLKFGDEIYISTADKIFKEFMGRCKYIVKINENLYIPLHEVEAITFDYVEPDYEVEA